MIKINSSFHSNSTESLHNTKENYTGRDIASICTAIEQEGRIDSPNNNSKDNEKYGGTDDVKRTSQQRREMRRCPWNDVVNVV